MRIYVGTYHKYASGSIAGKWMDVSDFIDKEDFLEACAELHSDEYDPEFMFQDWEDIPDSLITESWVHEMLWEPRIQDVIERDHEDLISEWNEYQMEERSADGMIFYHDEYFFEEMFHGNIDEAVRATQFGDYTYTHEYIRFDGYANLETTNHIEDWIDKSDLIEYLTRNL